MRNDSEHVESVLRNAMTVKDLRQMLEGYDDETPVLFVCDYGDYHHTQQALPVSECEEAESKHLSKSAYSHSEIALNDDEPEDGYDDLDEDERAEYEAYQAELDASSREVIILR